MIYNRFNSLKLNYMYVYKYCFLKIKICIIMKNNCGYGYLYLFYINYFLMKCRLFINIKFCIDIEQFFFMLV